MPLARVPQPRFNNRQHQQWAQYLQQKADEIAKSSPPETYRRLAAITKSAADRLLRHINPHITPKEMQEQITREISRLYKVESHPYLTVITNRPRTTKAKVTPESQPGRPSSCTTPTSTVIPTQQDPAQPR